VGSVALKSNLQDLWADGSMAKGFASSLARKRGWLYSVFSFPTFLRRTCLCVRFARFYRTSAAAAHTLFALQAHTHLSAAPHRFRASPATQ